MSGDKRTAAVPLLDVKRQDKLGQRAMAAALLAMVVVLDQATKWWAWRHVSGTGINSGGNPLVGRVIGEWYADPVTGAMLDLLDFGMLTIAIFVLLRRRYPRMVLVFGALVIGGWSSNLLDRLGLHYWTAPGSVRGAVDFIHIGSYYYNVADFFIVGATPVFLLALGFLWATKSSATIKAATPMKHDRPRLPARILSVAGTVGLVLVVSLSAANYGGVTAP